MTMGITSLDLDNWFNYHTPDCGQLDSYKELRDEARKFAYVILKLTPASADQTAAVRKLREAMMTANAAIACGGR